MARALPYMTEIQVDSSNIKSVWYNPGVGGQWILRITFLASKSEPERVYVYTGVTEPTFRGLMNAGSKGKYFHRNIKGKFPFYRES